MTRRIRFQSMWLMLLLLLDSPVSSVGAVAQQSASQTSRDSLENLPEQTIGPDDLLSISVFGAPEFSRSVRVSPEGNIRMPMVEEPVAAAGLLPHQVADRVAAALEGAMLLKDAAVTVNVTEYRSRPISVVGAVRNPITFQANGRVTLLDALSRAEGLSSSAGSEILVSQPTRDANGNSRSLVRRIPVRTLIDAADPAMNLMLEGGEEIRVPETGLVYVVGNVKKPGAFPIRDGSESSVLKLLALSEGLMPYCSKNAYIYRRESGFGGRNEIEISLANIVKRKSPDIPLLADDVLYIPDNKGRKVAMKTLQTVTSFGVGTLSGILVWH